MDIETAVALRRMISEIEVNCSSLDKSSPTTLLPPETRKIIGFSTAGSIQFRRTPRVIISASAYGIKGFTVSPGAAAPATMADFWSFVDKFKFVIIYIFAAYIFEFFTDYLRRKEYEVLPSDIQLKEIALFYFLLLVILGFFNGFAVAFSMDNELYQIIVLFIIIIVKTTAQVFLRKSKSKYFN